MPTSRNYYWKTCGLRKFPAKGFSDMGQLWREELQMADTENVIDRLYDQVRPLHTQLHAFTRGRLRQFYAANDVIIGPNQLLAAHLLGTFPTTTPSFLIIIIITHNSIN